MPPLLRQRTKKNGARAKLLGQPLGHKRDSVKLYSNISGLQWRLAEREGFTFYSKTPILSTLREASDQKIPPEVPRHLDGVRFRYGIRTSLKANDQSAFLQFSHAISLPQQRRYRRLWIFNLSKMRLAAAICLREIKICLRASTEEVIVVARAG